ncbi:MAG TPA: NAD(P)(+) transhydrogenase (Re/Si-specific) subunit beta [Actinocrinis sp.]|nr:NAD(P)(+) transhydrogenase (Re/Si-specific) subunit beta [Actinocrinis sp.]
MSAFDTVVRFVYLAAAVGFVLGLHLMKSPTTARRGNRLSAAGMLIAVATTAVVIVHDDTITSSGSLVLIAGGVLGAGAGLYAARTVQMTAMPQLVSIFNAVGGGAAALLAVDDLIRSTHVIPRVAVTGALDIVIGGVTFTGSLIAAGKLQGLVPGRPIALPGGRAANPAIAVLFTAGAIWLIARPGSGGALALTGLAALGFGVTMVLPIGGADMPVVISLLNAFTGTAVAMAGFVLDNTMLIIAGALVGASGSILTKLMADAMNRSIGAIVAGGFGTGDSATPVTAGMGSVREASVDDVAIQLAYAAKVIFVPGYGLAAAQAQHEAAELGELLEHHGVEVGYAIHPVAGRMPGHMNVLLAEANVPYPQLIEMEEANTQFPRADVALVVGANDVTNPAARRPGNAVSGMPILDVDKAKSVVVIKRSMGHGYAGIDNELYTDPKTGMLFNDAKKALAALAAAVKTLVGA